MTLFAIPFPAIDPVLVEIGPLAIRWYALAYIVGIFLGWWYAKRLVGNQAIWGPAGSPMKPADIDDFVVWCAVGIILGGRVGYVLFYDFPRFVENPLEIFALWHGGMSFHGGFLGTVLAMVIFARVAKDPDLVADRRHRPVGHLRPLPRPPRQLHQWRALRPRQRTSPGRWSSPTAVPSPATRASSTRRSSRASSSSSCSASSPTASASSATPGFVSGAFAAGYGVARTFVEFFREPDIQIGYLAGGLTMGMLLSIPMIVAGVALMLWVVAAEAGGDPGRVTPLGDKIAALIARERADHGRRLHGALPRRSRARLLHGPRAVRPRRRFRHRARGQPDLRRADRPLGGGDLAGDGRAVARSSSPSLDRAAAR